MPNSLQLNFSFSGDKRLSAAIMQGHFLNLVEVNPPSQDHSLEAALAITGEFARQLGNAEMVNAFVVTPQDGKLENSLSPIPFAAELAKISGKNIIIGATGQDVISNLRAIPLIAEAKALDFRNFFLTTGPLPSAELQTSDMTGYRDALDLLSEARNLDQDFLLGTDVNPYLYTPETQCAQYAKMVRKLRAGASYLLMKAGWDIKKSQELQWYLQKRGLPVPVFARIRYFSREEALKLNELIHDTYLPVPMASILMKEAEELEEDEFSQHQISRLALLVAGYRKMGFAGCQFAGFRDPIKLTRLLAENQSSDSKYPDFDSWLQQWNKIFGQYGFAPMLNPHYLFKGLMTPGHCCYDEQSTQTAGTPIPPPTLTDVCTYKLWRCLSHGPSALRKPLESLSKRTPEINRSLASCAFLNNADCPKKLSLGPCSQVRPDGSCECGDSRPCFFNRVVRLLAKYEILDRLEE